MIHAGDRIYTPRFCTVTITAVFESKEDAAAAGYKEPTYAIHPEYGIAGKTLDARHMEFAAYKKEITTQM